MNYLAHIFLSGTDTEVMLGNFIGDAVKGSDFSMYSEKIQTGIRLHRAIDTFTDAHSVVRQSITRLHHTHHHYSGVITDMFYDHFLAKYWNEYSQERLDTYVQKFYTSLNNHLLLFPKKIQHMAPYMTKQNWLFNYQYIEGLQQALSGMARRTSFPSGMETAHEVLLKYHAEFESEFRIFFPELQKMCEKYLSINAL